MNDLEVNGIKNYKQLQAPKSRKADGDRFEQYEKRPKNVSLKKNRGKIPLSHLQHYNDE